MKGSNGSAKVDGTSFNVLVEPNTASRIPYPSLDSLSPIKHARVFDPARKILLNVSRMALHASDGLWSAQAALGRATIDADLDHRLREMVILRVAYLQHSDYEIFHHKAIAANLGVTEAQQAAILSDDLSPLAEPERALMQFASEVILNVSPSDDALAAMREHYSDRILFDVVVVIGSYMLTARLAAVGGVAIEEQPVTGW